MENIVSVLRAVYFVLKKNLFDFRFTFDNPWLWICFGIIVFWMLKYWNLKKIIWFVICIGTLIFLRSKVYEYLASYMPGPREGYSDMLVGIIFSITVVIVVIYFLFVRQE